MKIDHFNFESIEDGDRLFFRSSGFEGLATVLQADAGDFVQVKFDDPECTEEDGWIRKPDMRNGAWAFSA